MSSGNTQTAEFVSSWCPSRWIQTSLAKVRWFSDRHGLQDIRNYRGAFHHRFVELTSKNPPASPADFLSVCLPMEAKPQTGTQSLAGVIGVTWLDRRNDPTNLSYQPFFSQSKNSGGNYIMGHALSSKLSNPDNDGFGGGFMGDYTGNAWNGTTTVYQSYMDTTTGTCQDFVTGVLFP